MNSIVFGKIEAFGALETQLKTICDNTNIFVIESLPLARRFLEGNEVDLIFLKTEAEKDWLYVVKELEKANRRIRFVLLSRDDNQSIRAFEAGAFDYLLEPIKKNQLERVIKKLEKLIFLGKEAN